MAITPSDMEPTRPNSKVCAKALGILAIIPTVIISEEPLPTPREVICSPSQTINIVPPTSETIVVNLKMKPGITTADKPALPVMPSKPTAMP